MSPLGGAAVLASVALALYAYTAAPDLTLVDSGELALVCATGGVAHPPGFPLYLIVGRVFTWLPLGSPVRALNLMSAFWMALAVGAVFLLAERAIASAESEDTGGAGRILGAAVAALTFATARNPWTWSGLTEVYALNVFLLAGGWAAAWAAIGVARGRRDGSLAWGPIAAACAFAALGLANHHATALLLFPVLGFMAAVALPLLLRFARFWLMLTACVMGASSLYLYLLVAAAGDPGLGWGGIDNLSLLLRHVTGQQYKLQVGSGPAQSIDVAREFFRLLVFGAGIPATLLLAVGCPLAADAIRKGRDRLLVLGAPAAMIGLNLALSVTYVAGPEDRMAYDLPATVAWCVLVGIGAWAIAGRLPRNRRMVAAAAAIALVVCGNIVSNLDRCNLRRETTARTFVRETVEQVPLGSLLVTSEWNYYAPFLYMRHVEGFRPDLDVVDALMMRRFWYFDYLERTMPRTISESRAEFDALRDQATRFDLELPFDAEAIQGQYDRLMSRWVEIGRDRAGAYVDWASFGFQQEVSWIRPLPRVPEGLLVRFVPAGSSTLPPPIAPKDPANLAHVRSKLTDKTVRGDRSDLEPRHDPYRKVWSPYQRSVEASLQYWSRHAGEEALAPLIEGYAEWYPEMGIALERFDRQ